MFRNILDWFFNVDEDMGENKYARLLGVLIFIVMGVFAIYHKEVMSCLSLFK